MELLGHVVVLVLVFVNPPYCGGYTYFHSGCTEFTFTSTAYRVPFSPRSCKRVICVLFDGSHSDSCEVKGFDLPFLDE